MNQLRCSQCKAELAPEARFCRQCGTPVPVSDEIDWSEMPTAVLSDKPNSHSTQRLEPRPTSSERHSFTLAEKATTIETSKPRRRRVPATVLFGLVFLVIIGIVSSVAYVRRNHNNTANNSLIYPGAKTILDLKDSGALQLQTEDSIDRVVAWYGTTIKPTKTLRLTPSNVVLKNQSVIVTVASDGGKTSILIKEIRDRIDQ